MGSPKLSEVAEKVRTKFWLLQNVSFCILLGAFIGIGYFLLIESNLGGDYSKFWVYGVSALVTLFASGVALVGVFSNIENQHKISRDQKDASLRASKAMLPSVLAELSRRCEHNAFVVLLNSKNAVSSTEKLPKHLEKYIGADIKPFLEGQEFQTFRDCIEFADEQSAEILQHIVSRYQVLFSRCHGRDFPSIKADKKNRVTSIPRSIEKALDWNLLYLAISHCFSYARTTDSREKIDREFDQRSLSNIFSGAVESTTTLIPHVVSYYIQDAETETQTLASNYANAVGNIDLSHLLKP
ncbi:hypothetical protein [Phaeobacter italicus]|uniref:hypothetical protein n=1 Tax=Phaeobacter italicus TaxID=481446 RepID=UPI001CD4A8A9|nr:hypothetical protein [Phaeobacter italicus]MCA0855450.1 hypothetical protein [Phaeobacter italicus]